jgi:hypothetical protein
MVNEAHGLSLNLEGLQKPSEVDESAIMSPEFRSTSPDALAMESSDVSKPIDIQTTVNNGFIDVKFSFPEFGSPLGSPAMIVDHSGSSFGESSIGQNSLLSLTPKEPEHPLNVGGWLDRLHPDFALQAVKPHADIIKDVKAAMSAEPNPVPLAVMAESGPAERWLDVCTSLVADTSTYTVTRFRLRRLVKFVRQPNQTVVTPGIHGHPLRSQYGNPYSQSQHAPTPAMTEITLEEKFEEERIMDMDGTFVDVLERIITTSGSPPKGQSVSSSRSSSRRGRTEPLPRGEHTDGLDVPRDCKKLIIGTLEQIAASVARERSAVPSEKAKLRRPEADVDSTLLDGIRNWFDEVEAKAGTDPSGRTETAKEVVETRPTAPAKEIQRDAPVPPQQQNTPQVTVPAQVG